MSEIDYNKKIAQGAITTGSGTLLYTTPTQFKARVGCIDICNTTSSSLTATIHLVPSGDSVAAANMIFPAVTIDAYSMVQWTGIQFLNSGDFIQGIGSGSGLTVNISGEELR